MSTYQLLGLVLIPLIGSIFALTARDDKNYATSNVYNVSILTLLANVGLILYIFSQCNLHDNNLQLVEHFKWIDYPEIDISLGVDVFSLLIILSVNLSFLIGELCLSRHTERSKTLITSELLFIGLVNGYFIAADVLSFYIFFVASGMPLMILISTYGSQRKKTVLIRFSIYNLIGALLLLVAIVMMCDSEENNILLNEAGKLNFKGGTEYFVWLSIFFAFISRLPIWPFHYWISSINSSLKNPLVFLVGNLIPLIGLYGFIRFWPNTVPQSIAIHAPIFEIVCIITMLFIALVSLSHKDIRYKLFAYTTVYYLLYLTSVFLPTDVLKLNIGYSLFSYIIIVTVLSFLISHIEYQKKKLGIYGTGGILCYMPRTSKCLSLFILAGVGLPVTSLFWNNFIIISEIFNYNLVLGIMVMLSIFVVALALLEELYKLKDKSSASAACVLGGDLPNLHFFVYLSCLVILFLSFFKPLWFVF